MRGLTITDYDQTKGGLALELKDILRLLGAKAGTSTWRVRNVEVIGRNADRLQTISDTEGTIAGDDLIKLADGIDQTIDGLFELFRPREKEPWLRIRAVDGTAFDVESDDIGVLEKIKGAFESANWLPD